MTVIILGGVAACSGSGGRNAGLGAAGAIGGGLAGNLAGAPADTVGDAGATDPNPGAGTTPPATGLVGGVVADAGVPISTVVGGAVGGTVATGAIASGGRTSSTSSSRATGGAATSVSRTGGGVGGGGSIGVGGTNAGGTTSQGGTVAPGDIGTWTDAPGACPSGMPQVEITTLKELADASRGEGSRASDPASVCYLIRNGRYVQSGSTLPLWVKKGGPDASHRRVFVGESRTGVVIVGRGSVASGANHVQLSNLTMDMTGYSQSGSFSTLDLSDGATDIRIDHVTFTGDCKTGVKGGHIEVLGATDVVVESCLIEKFGRCGPNGHEEHGVYLANGSNLTLRNNEIRGNASRGIQLYTQGGEYGTLDKVVIERNRIHDNGHADYEDGIAMGATDEGTITNVTIQHNLLYNNYYSGIRESGNAYKAIVIRANTFYKNGATSTSSSASEINLDGSGSGAATSVTRNIFVVAKKLLNNCYTASGFTLTDNVVQGSLPTGSAGSCISGSITADPKLDKAAEGNFQPQNPDVAAYGAYSP